MYHCRFLFVPESTSYVFPFRMISVFLPCDHGLDFLHQLTREFNQSTNHCSLYLSRLLLCYYTVHYNQVLHFVPRLRGARSCSQLLVFTVFVLIFRFFIAQHGSELMLFTIKYCTSQQKFCRLYARYVLALVPLGQIRVISCPRGNMVGVALHSNIIFGLFVCDESVHNIMKMASHKMGFANTLI